MLFSTPKTRLIVRLSPEPITDVLPLTGKRLKHLPQRSNPSVPSFVNFIPPLTSPLLNAPKGILPSPRIDSHTESKVQESCASFEKKHTYLFNLPRSPKHLNLLQQHHAIAATTRAAQKAKPQTPVGPAETTPPMIRRSHHEPARSP